MAAYPTTIGLKFSISPANERRTSISEAGTVRFINLGAVTAFDFVLTHPYCTASERDTLLAFYTSYKDVANTATLGGVNYSFQFKADYRVVSESAAYFTLTAEFSGTKV